MEIAFASRYVDGRRVFTHISTALPLPQSPGDGDPLEESFCWHVLNGRLPELIQDAQEVDFALSLAVTKALPIGAHINVPLRLKDGSVYGSFCCLSRTADSSLTERDLATLRAFADLAVEQIEIENRAEAHQRQVAERIDAAIAGGMPTMLYQPKRS